MYRNCIFCSADLGSNESLEHFPVGARLAFDAWKGRLWAVCPKCARWNLSPIEERWEAVEEAEKHFREARLRVQSENVGLAKLRDGTRLIRVGEALPGELAAWRYGDTLRKRRQRYYLLGGVAVAAPLAAFGGLWAVGAASTASGAWQIGVQVWKVRRSRKVVHRLRPADSPTGQEYLIRRYHFNGARVLPGDDAPTLWLPYAHEHPDGSTSPIRLQGATAERMLTRMMVTRNVKGANRRQTDDALDLLGASGGAEGFLRVLAGQEPRLGLPGVQDYNQVARLGSPMNAVRGAAKAVTSSFRGKPVPYHRKTAAQAQRGLNVPGDGEQLTAPEALALEMALHEESERRALQGELAQLEAAWREAEEIAAIADSLGNDPLARLKNSSPPPDQEPSWP